jgi:hypothetical protein
MTEISSDSEIFLKSEKSVKNIIESIQSSTKGYFESEQDAIKLFSNKIDTFNPVVDKYFKMLVLSQLHTEDIESVFSNGYGLKSTRFYNPYEEKDPNAKDRLESMRDYMIKSPIEEIKENGYSSSLAFFYNRSKKLYDYLLDNGFVPQINYCHIDLSNGVAINTDDKNEPDEEIVKQEIERMNKAIDKLNSKKIVDKLDEN